MKFIKCILPLCFLFFFAPMTWGISDEYKKSVEEDWLRQEQRLGRIPSDISTLQFLLERGEKLLNDLKSREDAPDWQSGKEKFEPLLWKIRDVENASEAERMALYYEIRWFNRELALKNPLFANTKLVFMQRRRFICQMLHEYLGYFYDYGDIAGGGIYVLNDPGNSPEITDLIQNRLPKGNYTTLSLSFDAKTIYFAFSERAEQKPDFYSSERRSFHIYSMNADGTNLRQLTSGIEDDFDPCELPCGDLVFMSTRRGGFGRCHNPWEPLPVYTLHRIAADGNNIRTLSFHETNEWHPQILNDGRVIYTRWDYVDRSAANYHGLWTSNPDGSNPMILFGNYTQRINACYQPHSIPGSNKVMFVAGAHHADVGGSLVIADPSRTSFHRENGQDDFSSLEFLTPEICFPEGEGWPSSYFHSPWPLSENYFLVSFSFDPLPGMGPKVEEDTHTGLYLLDRFGNLELLYREEDISSMYPIPLRSRPVPPEIPSTLDEKLGEEGEFLLADVYQSHFSLPENRPVRSLRVFQILPKSETHVANQPRLGYANAESARMLLGTVPVEEDGSAYFRAPSRVPLAFQAVDEQGRAVQGMRSIIYLQPGERRGCAGCHEPVRSAAINTQRIAFSRAPSAIQPGPDGTYPWSYPRLIQPVLDQKCIQCHDGSDSNHSRPDLRGEMAGAFSISYESLKPFVRWYEWGGATINEDSTKPGYMPADVSSLVEILQKTNHKDYVQLSEEEWRRMYIWLDGNASFYGAYSQPEQLAQSRGECIPPPKLQ